MEQAPEGADPSSSSIAGSERISTAEPMQEDKPDLPVKSGSEAGCQQENVSEPMQHDTPDEELNNESEVLKNEKSVFPYDTGSGQVNPSEAVDHVTNKLVDGSETVGSQQGNVPEVRQQDTPHEELKPESEPLKSEKSSFHGDTSSKQVNPSEAMDHVTNKLVDARETGGQQTNLPRPKQRGRPDDELKHEKNVKKKVTLVFPPGYPSEAVERSRPNDLQHGSKPGISTPSASQAKRNTGVVTLKDIEAEPWYNNSDAKYPEAVKESRNAATMPWTKVALWKGDITKLQLDAIVNAANSRLLGGGGVDGAIHAAAGPKLKEECRTLKFCDPGDAKITKGYNLPAKHVIHTVGPMDGNPNVLRSCYDRCFQLMAEHKLKSVAFPCIATGIYGFPNDEAADIALSATHAWLEQHHADVEKVVFCVFLSQDFELYKEKLPINFRPDDVWRSGSSSNDETANSSPSVVKGDVGSEAGSEQLAEVGRVGECAGREHADDVVMPADTGATAAVFIADASHAPDISTAAEPAAASDMAEASSVAETAVDVSDQPTCNEGNGCSI